MTVNNRSTKPIADLQVCMGERCAIEVQLPAGGFVMSSMRAPGNAKPLLRWHLDGRGLQRHADVEVGRLTTGTLELGIAEDGKVTVEKQQLERGPLGCYWKE